MMKYCRKCGSETERYKSGGCKTCTLRQVAAYHANNKEKISERQAVYRANNKEKISEKQAAYRAENKEKISEIKAKHYAENRERFAEYYFENREKILVQKAKYRSDNREKLYEKNAKWRVDNPSKILAIKHNRRARKLTNGGKLSPDIRDRLMALQNGRCAVCRTKIKDKSHLDHVIPIAKGGRNDDENVQLLCPPCNLQKHIKDPIEFMQSRGFLL